MMTGEPCPNQIPVGIRTGIGLMTETVTGIAQDPSASYLVANELIQANTLFSVSAGAAITREKSKAGADLKAHYTSIQNMSNDKKCQYTFRSSTSPTHETYWILPQPDVITISEQGISKSLKTAFQNRSELIDEGHIAQHTC